MMAYSQVFFSISDAKDNLMSNIEKKKLFDEWASNHTKHCIQLFDRNNQFNKADALLRLLEFVNIIDNSVYLVVATIQEIDIPIYIGKSKAPFARWKQHIAGFESGNAGYAKWRSLLLRNNGLFNFDVKLMVIPETKILFPPIHGFPITIGAVEYQLVSLISDLYPKTLLNSEGNRR